MSNPNCKQWDCGDGCCNYYGNCLTYTLDSTTSQCYYYYSSSSTSTSTSSSSSYYNNTFPSSWAVPLIVVGTFIIVFFCILCIRRYQRRH
jgi:hypothetical protein